ncbi:pyrroloquinoline quinone biosynthesis protein PqqE [Acidocella sp. MX-AZ02]|uniref:pyrroloquinoline quinone biosynthesis protein PqqE n=1 Tax=Acidocella sp. MX-AZ02 TaxID=1214225 RepID=UPI00028EFB68|nr:pyrroloquinoline quinone biosynthesis protein PqqE [Acidocella sp. MX-AZ02]EKM98945.1 pyrroloquinoline quinone biosynthesis protein PqqE [Acidocella sp. MX-AZ02]
MSSIAPPFALMAELTHRCPLQCPYCSNPLEMLKANKERDTAFWRGVISEAASMGVLQIHFSGGEPSLRPDLAALIAHATDCGMYANLITSAVLLNRDKLSAYAQAGLGHVQVSLQGAEAANADRIGNYKGAHRKKLEVAKLVTQIGMSLTINAVVHRQNLEELPAIIDLALALDADRLEIAHVQYHGWALENRAALIPTRAQFEAADALVARRREEIGARMVIDYVVPDYYADLPKTCMGGWGQKMLNIAPDGRVLPCHAAETIPGLTFPRADDLPLREIWEGSDAFNKFRGTGWMQEPCSSCALKEIDWGGCRCQAMAITGDAAATDPVCSRSPRHAAMNAMAAAEAQQEPGDFKWRRVS